MTADRTELQQLAAAPTQSVDTLIAHDLTAMRALMGHGGVLVARANQGAIGKDDGGCRRTDSFEFRDRDLNVGAFHQQFHVAEAQDLPSRQPGLTDGFAVDEGAIGRTAVPDNQLAVTQNDFAVFCRNRRVLDLKIVSRHAAEPIHTEIQLDNLASKAV